MFFYVLPGFTFLAVDDVHRLLQGQNPRFIHTFCDEDWMSLLKKWRRRSSYPHQVLRLSRFHLKTLKWRFKET